MKNSPTPPITTNTSTHTDLTNTKFSGNIFIFHALDIGDDINFEKIRKARAIDTAPLQLPKYFKNYHTPLAVELPHPHQSSRLISSKIHSFGVVSLTYKIPFSSTLEDVRTIFEETHNHSQEESIIDAKSIFKRTQKYITQPHFFHMQSHYALIQVNPSDTVNVADLKGQLGGVIASTLRFETETLSEYQKDTILDATLGYFRGDLLVVDTDASFIYNKEYEEVLDLFEFVNIQLLELRYFDRLLDKQLNRIYEGDTRGPHLLSYIPFIGPTKRDPVEALGKLKVDISVITERLEGSIKLAGEPYIEELYDLLIDRLDLGNWRQSIERKLNIVESIQRTYQQRIQTTREDILSVLIVILIFIELVVGILHYMK